MEHVLIIEDNKEIRENSAEILELAGYKVSAAENGKEGVEKAMQNKPDIIVCDIMMPVLDGYGVLHLIKGNPELAAVPFIFLTAKAERSDFRRGMELGADDYITKPFTETELLGAIESRLHKVKILKNEYEASHAGVKQFINELNGDQALTELTQNSSLNDFRKKQIIYKEGSYPVRLFYLEKGKVKTYKMNDEGKELTVGLYNDGDFFGYTALLEESPYKETAEAIDDAEISVIDKEEFEKLMNSNMEVQRKFIKMLAKNVAEREEQLLAIAYNSLRKKVANALMILCNKYKAGDNLFSIHISREDLANIAGTATESLIRTLSDFKSEKLIEIKNGEISILNEKKLENMLN